LFGVHFLKKYVLFQRPSQQVGEMSDSRRCSSADSENICVKKFTKIYSRQGAASKIFRDTKNSSFSPVDFINISKFTSVGKFFY